jgi:hypothetical protein
MLSKACLILRSVPFGTPPAAAPQDKRARLEDTLLVVKRNDEVPT